MTTLSQMELLVRESTSRPENLEKTKMYAEAAESADVVGQQIIANRVVVGDLVTHLLKNVPRTVITCARGSSDHAATFFKYLVESELGIVTSSASPSVQSVYDSPQHFDNSLYVAITQSGASPDLLENTEKAKASGATVLVLVNDESSPIVSLADFLIPLHAGTESSVAATKSFISTISAMLHIVSAWSANRSMKYSLSELPDQLRTAWNLDWSLASDMLIGANNLYVVARGLGLGIAQEAALKLKEVCGLHAEAFSSAEVRHGPMALIGRDFPILVFAQHDQTWAGIETLLDDIRAMGADVCIAADQPVSGKILPVVAGAHHATQPLLQIQTFYRMCNELSIRRGFDPDRPPNLRKVTRTV